MTATDQHIEAAWGCRSCQVDGRDPEVPGQEITCWNCGGPVRVYARPTLQTKIPGS